MEFSFFPVGGLRSESKFIFHFQSIGTGSRPFCFTHASTTMVSPERPNGRPSSPIRKFPIRASGIFYCKKICPSFTPTMWWRLVERSIISISRCVTHAASRLTHSSTNGQARKIIFRWPKSSCAIQARLSARSVYHSQ